MIEAHSYLKGVSAGIAVARAEERERIIKLLDSYTMYRFEKELMIKLIEEGW